MTTLELKNLITFTNSISSISLCKTQSDFYEIWFSGQDNDAYLRNFGLSLRAARGNIKTYKSLDKAVSFLRGLGWVGDITIQDIK